MINNTPGPRLDLLTAAQCEQIHWASLKILERTGVDVRLPEALELLTAAGADGRDPGHVKIPAHMVEAALGTAPHRMTIYDRNGTPAMDLEGRNCHYGTGTETPFVIDPYSGQRRAVRGEDVDRAARVADALPNIDFVASMGSVSPEEVPSRLSDCHNFARILTNTTKPILFTAWDEQGLAAIHAMALAACGDDGDEFASRPFIIQYVEPISPLCHPADSLAKLLYCVRHGIPVTYASGTMMGGTVPVTTAGALAVTNAEFLSALVVAQLVRPGAGVIYGGCSGPLDMQTGICIYNGPDAYQSYHMTRELAAWYDLPDFNYGGCTDAKTLDCKRPPRRRFPSFRPVWPAAVWCTTWATWNRA